MSRYNIFHKNILSSTDFSSAVFNTDKNKFFFLSSKSTYYYGFWRIKWHWKYCFAITGINHILKYINIEMINIESFLFVIIFNNIVVLLYFLF